MTKKILIGNEASFAVADTLGKGTYTIVPSFVTDFKAIKNQTELKQKEPHSLWCCSDSIIFLG